MSATLVLGVGNPDRGDDGAGPALVARLRSHAPRGADLLASHGEFLGLLSAMEGRERVILVDAARSGRAPGSIARFPGADLAGMATLRAGSTHALGLEQALGLLRAIGRPPGEVVVYAIEGRSFRPGNSLSPAVARALRRAERMVREEIGPCRKHSKAVS
jgi:hydrogenase maturation protease